VNPVTAAKLLKQDCSVEVSPEKFIDLLKSGRGELTGGIHPYCGPCDRQVFMYLAELSLSDAELKAIDGREVSPNVHTRLLPLDQLTNAIHDFVGLSLLAFYRNYGRH
jgi:hypothetical protein